MVVALEGSALDYQELAATIERKGAVVHSVDELVHRQLRDPAGATSSSV